MSNEQLIGLNVDTLATRNPIEDSIWVLLRTLQARLRMKYNRSEAQYKKNREKEQRDGDAAITRGEVEDTVTRAVGKALEDFAKRFPHQADGSTETARRRLTHREGRGASDNAYRFRLLTFETFKKKEMATWRALRAKRAGNQIMTEKLKVPRAAILEIPWVNSDC